MRAFYCDRFVLPLPPGHSFPMGKYARLRDAVLHDGSVAPDELLEPEAASRADLALVHDAAYIEAVFSGSLPAAAQRRIGFPWSPEMVERSRRSVGATITAAKAALEDGLAANLAGGTHHAYPEHGEGYCVFNDIAVAARVLQRDALLPPRSRIAIVDCDVHQGNGTAAIFQHDDSVFTLSIHGEKNFPFRKAASDLDVALPDGTGDGEYLAHLERALAVVEEYRPAFVFYLSGADAYEGDRLGRLALTVDGLRARDRLVLERFRALPVAVAMGGGYCPEVDVTARIHANTILEAARLSSSPSVRRLTG